MSSSPLAFKDVFSIPCVAQQQCGLSLQNVPGRGKGHPLAHSGPAPLQSLSAGPSRGRQQVVAIVARHLGTCHRDQTEVDKRCPVRTGDLLSSPA